MFAKSADGFPVQRKITNQDRIVKECSLADKFLEKQAHHLFQLVLPVFYLHYRI
jgi:hypothetical protein